MPGEGGAKRSKDLRQSAHLIEALIELRRGDDLAEAYAEAWGRGRAWGEAIASSLGALPPELVDRLAEAWRDSALRLGLDSEEVATSFSKPARNTT